MTISARPARHHYSYDEYLMYERDSRMKHGHRLDAVRAHLLELAGHPEAAREHYLSAARRTSSVPERHYLTGRAARLDPLPPSSRPPAQ